jgi:hypothetical protein
LKNLILAALITLFIGGQASAASIDTVFGVNDFQVVAFSYDDDYDDDDYDDDDYDDEDDDDDYDDDDYDDDDDD